MTASSPIIDNSYKDTIRGNVLDLFDAPTYDVKIYMIPFGDVLRNRYTSDSQEVILAQTNRTADAQIDDVEIETVAGDPDKPLHHRSVTFKITQPGAVDFIDQIKLTRAYLGYPVTAENSPIFMEIRFVGYSEETNENDVIRGPYRFRLELAQIEFNITPEGSTYEFSCVFVDSTGYNNIHFKMPSDKSTIGRTIRDHVTDSNTNLQKIIEEHYEEFAEDHALRDQFEFDLSDPSFAEWADKEVEYDPEVANILARTIDPDVEGLSTEEIQDRDRNDGSLRGFGPRPWRDGTKFTAKRGLSIEYYIFYLLAMIPDFFEAIARMDRNRRVNNQIAFVKKLVVDVHVEYLDEQPKATDGSPYPGAPNGFDFSRNTLAKKFIYRPKLIDVPGENQVYNPLEVAPTPAEQQSRLSQYVVEKAYRYMYTGLNDQILNVDLSYNHGHAILLAPLGGFVDEAQNAGGLLAFTRRFNTEESAAEVNEQIQDNLRSGLANQAIANIDVQLRRDDLSESERSELENELASVRAITSRDLSYNQLATVLRSQTRVDAGSDFSSSARSTGSVGAPERATLISYVYQNSRNQEAYLARINLSLRGDPYYLGPDGDGGADDHFSQDFSPNGENMHFRNRPPLILFELQTPRLHNEETGEWVPGTKSYFMSGLYEAVKIRHSLSGGVYTCEVDAVRQTAINLASLDAGAVEAESRNAEISTRGFSAGRPAP